MHCAGDNLSVVKAFCKRALAGIKPVLIKDSKAAAFALRNKAEIYEADRQRRLRINLPISSETVVFHILSRADKLIFDLRVPNPANRKLLIGVGTIEVSFQQLLCFAGFPTVRA
jgi:hypothetical protein